MKKTKTKVIDLDALRGKDEALFVCLHQDCFKSFNVEIPRRKNFADNITCPSCQRDFFQYWIQSEDGDHLFVNFGNKRKPRKKS